MTAYPESDIPSLLDGALAGMGVLPSHAAVRSADGYWLVACYVFPASAASGAIGDAERAVRALGFDCQISLKESRKGYGECVAMMSPR